MYAGATANRVLTFEVRYVGPNGDYTGALKLSPTGGKETPVTLTLTVKDEIALPLAILIFSIWFALVIKR